MFSLLYLLLLWYEWLVVDKGKSENALFVDQYKIASFVTLFWNVRVKVKESKSYSSESKGNNNKAAYYS